MRKLTIVLTVLAVEFYCFGTTRAQSKSHEAVANIEQAIKEMEPTWRCLSVPTPQGDPEPDTPHKVSFHMSAENRGRDCVHPLW